MLLAVVVVRLSFCNANALLPDAAAGCQAWGPFVEGSQPSPGSSSLRKQAPCYSAGAKQDAWVTCTAAVCPPNSNIAATPPSYVLPTHAKPRHAYTTHRKIGKDETRYTNLSHTKNRSAGQLCFPVSAPIRFSLDRRSSRKETGGGVNLRQ